MQINADQLTRHLERGLAASLCRERRRAAADRRVLRADPRARRATATSAASNTAGPGFDWDQLRTASQSLSLFAERRLFELRLRPGGPATPAPSCWPTTAHAAGRHRAAGRDRQARQGAARQRVDGCARSGRRGGDGVAAGRGALSRLAGPAAQGPRAHGSSRGWSSCLPGTWRATCWPRPRRSISWRCWSAADRGARRCRGQSCRQRPIQHLCTGRCRARRGCPGG